MDFFILVAAFDPVVDEILDRTGHGGDHVGVIDLVFSQMGFADEKAALLVDDKEGGDQCFGTLFEKQFRLADAGYPGFNFPFEAFKRETFVDLVVDRLHQFTDSGSDIFADHTTHNRVE